MNKILNESTHFWIDMYNQSLSTIREQHERYYGIPQKNGLFPGSQNRFKSYNGELKIIKMNRR